MKTKGLSFKKFDLHIHTPASSCFSDKNVSPDDIISLALDKGLSAIAITDHNSGEYIDMIKKAAEGTPLTVFPGVEITVGDAHIHLIAILDKDKNTRDIGDLLTTLGILHDQYGKKNTFVQKTVSEVIEIISSKNFNGLAIAAHIDSTNGIFDDMEGEARKEVIKNPKLLAAEAIDYEKVYKFLDGSDPNYQRKLAVYQASDNPYLDKDGKIIVTGEHSGEHNINGIGYRYSYFKVDENISLESIRQCFIDPSVRIRQSFEYKEKIHPFIKKVKINSGFLNDLNLDFHNGMNSILGAKGVGKSLLIEFMRFALNQGSSNEDIEEDHEEKLSKQLGQYGQVEVTIQDETGKEFVITRIYDTSEDSPINVLDSTSNGTIDVDISSLFPVLFLSQTEIIKIAEDPDEQLKFIDKFFDFHRYINQINYLEAELKKLDKSFADSLEAYHNEKSIGKILETAKQERDRLSRQLKNPIFDEFSELEDKDKSFRTNLNFLDSLTDILTEYENIINGNPTPVIPDKLSSDPSIKRVNNLIETVKKDLVKSINDQSEKLNETKKLITDEYKNWKDIFDDKKIKFQEQIKLLGGDSQILEEKRKLKLKEIEELENKLRIIKQKANQIKSINIARNKKLVELENIYKGYFKEREDKCKFFEKASNNKLKVTIIGSTNKDEFINSLTSLKKGSYLRDVEIEKLCENITPKEFILNLLRYDISRLDESSDSSKHINTIAEKVNISTDKIKSLVEYLLDTKSCEELLLLQYKAIPQDEPEIKYNTGNYRQPNYVLLKNLSTGQKCTAMVILALSEGIMSIVIDQPEDSLDIRAIWDDMCCKLRAGKENRQFIFTTHNSSVAVASDTDKFIIMTSSATRGEVVFSGAIDNNVVREEVIRYLEGGFDTYRLKYLKYNILNNLK